MKTKKFQHNKVEKCGLCKKEIFTSKSNWSTIIDYTGKTLRSIRFYHTRCLKNLILEKGERIKRELEDRWKKKAIRMMKKILPAGMQNGISSGME